MSLQKDEQASRFMSFVQSELAKMEDKLSGKIGNNYNRLSNQWESVKGIVNEVVNKASEKERRHYMSAYNSIQSFETKNNSKILGRLHLALGWLAESREELLRIKRTFSKDVDEIASFFSLKMLSKLRIDKEREAELASLKTEYTRLKSGILALKKLSVPDSAQLSQKPFPLLLPPTAIDLPPKRRALYSQNMSIETCQRPRISKRYSTLSLVEPVCANRGDCARKRSNADISDVDHIEDIENRNLRNYYI